MRKNDIKKMLTSLEAGNKARTIQLMEKNLAVAMDATIGPEGLDKTWQKEFPSTVNCAYCGAKARHAFTVHEGITEKIDDTVSGLHPNTMSESDGAFWPHDVIAVAVYFCTTGFCEPTARYNQG